MKYFTVACFFITSIAFGQFSVGKDAVVTEIGESSIIAMGSSDFVGKLSLKGRVLKR